MSIGMGLGLCGCGEGEGHWQDGVVGYQAAGSGLG